MAFQLSPGVLVVEKDFTSIVPAVSTSTGAFAGLFQWGPVLAPVSITGENVLVQRFGLPNDATAASFFTAANFLSYSNDLIVNRISTVGAKNAVTTKTGSLSTVTISNGGHDYSASTSVVVGAPDIAGGVQAVGSATIRNGVILGVAVTNGGADYTSATLVTFSAPPSGGVRATGVAVIAGGEILSITITNKGYGYIADPDVTVTDTGGGAGFIAGAITRVSGHVTLVTLTHQGTGYTSAPSITLNDTLGADFVGTAVAPVLAGVKINNESFYMEQYVNGAGVVGEWAAKYPGALGNSIEVQVADSATFTGWAYAGQFDSAPGTSDYVARLGGSDDEVHIVVIDTDGKWTGTAGALLESFAHISKAHDAKKGDGANNYYKDVINSQSRYVWWMDHVAGLNWGGDGTTTFDTLMAAAVYTLSGGTDDFSANDGDYTEALALFANDELYDISLIATGAVSATVAKFAIENVAEVRKDCVAFASPVNIADNSVIIGTGSDAVDKVKAYRNDASFNVSSSYGVLDSGYKYQYDRYNDKYRWVPLNGDIAGLCARTDYTNDAWWSPGGLNRGQVKNIVKLAFNPGKTERDNLYKAGVNPVVNFPGQGTVLFGDKTLLSKPSAFDRINVRRLFIVLEKAIAIAAKYQLFEFNDSFTRAQFKNLVEPFLRDVQGRRGVTDFRVKCDDKNNTGEVIDRNEFVADIFIKPARSINFITLNFVAARTSVSFEEIGA